MWHNGGYFYVRFSYLCIYSIDNAWWIDTLLIICLIFMSQVVFSFTTCPCTLFDKHNLGTFCRSIYISWLWIYAVAVYIIPHEIYCCENTCQSHWQQPNNGDDNRGSYGEKVPNSSIINVEFYSQWCLVIDYAPYLHNTCLLLHIITWLYDILALV